MQYFSPVSPRPPEAPSRYPALACACCDASPYGRGSTVLVHVALLSLFLGVSATEEGEEEEEEEEIDELLDICSSRPPRH